jgi:hypothetical protein
MQPTTARDRWITLLAVLGWLLFFALMLLMPAVNGPMSTVLHTASVSLGIVLLLGLLMTGERANWPKWARWAMFIGGLALIFLPYLLQIKLPFVRAFTGLGLIAVALPVGYWLAGHMEKLTNLIPLAVAMSLADIFSVFAGLTAKVGKDISTYQAAQVEAGERAMATAPSGQEIEAAREAMASVYAPLSDFIIAHFPIAGTGATTPVLGIGDFIALAFLYRCAWVHHISPRVVFAAGMLSTFAALVVSFLLAQYGGPQFRHGIAALPFITLGTVGLLWLVEPRIRRMDRQEKMLTAVVIALFAALIVFKLLSVNRA